MSRTQQTFISPIVLSRRWLAEIPCPSDYPLLNLSQAAPADPPPETLRQAIAEAALHDTSAHLYGAVLGRAELRQALAENVSRHYQADVQPAQVAITAGCNQAFTATIASLCTEGDEVILPTPWYFNHKMALDLAGVRAVPLAVGPDMLPEIASAEALITERTRAIVLVTPNNPCGVEYPDGLLSAFYQLAKTHQISLIVDETYRDFDSRSEVAHHLFQQPDWGETLVHLYSFSKAYRLTGHRVGAILTDESKMFEIEKFLDTHTICPNQIGQIAAHWGIGHLGDWLQGERQTILKRRAKIVSGFERLVTRGWRLLGCGAYFAYVAHPFAATSDEIAKQMLAERGILMLPGTMFTPEGDTDGTRQFRIAFANIDEVGIDTLFDRLADWAPAQ